MCFSRPFGTQDRKDAIHAVGTLVEGLVIEVAFCGADGVLLGQNLQDEDLMAANIDDVILANLEAIMDIFEVVSGVDAVVRVVGSGQSGGGFQCSSTIVYHVFSPFNSPFFLGVFGEAFRFDILACGFHGFILPRFIYHSVISTVSYLFRRPFSPPGGWALTDGGSLGRSAEPLGFRDLPCTLSWPGWRRSILRRRLYRSPGVFSGVAARRPVRLGVQESSCEGLFDFQGAGGSFAFLVSVYTLFFIAS